MLSICIKIVVRRMFLVSNKSIFEEKLDVTVWNSDCDNYNPEEEWFMKIKDDTNDSKTFYLIGYWYYDQEKYEFAKYWYMKAAKDGLKKAKLINPSVPTGKFIKCSAVKINSNGSISIKR